MKIVQRDHIDTLKWDALVESSSDAAYSYSWYLDGIAENWSILVNDNYTRGMALPFAKRVGVTTLYNPIFGGYVEFFGESMPQDELANLLTTHFDQIECSINAPLLGELGEKRHYQEIAANEEAVYKSQAKNSIKKALKNGLHCKQTKEFKAIYNLTRNLLLNKFDGIDDKAFDRLAGLLKSVDSVCFEVHTDDFHGGIICLETINSVLYLKGSVDDHVRILGGMYLAMEAAIIYAKSVNKRFDFGGSNVVGVAAFNANLGGTDASYYHYSIDNSPGWYKLSKKIAKSVKSK
jgi:hypothetical protein